MITWIESPESSNIVQFGYDAERCVLAVMFKSGGQYEYYDVPQNVFEQMQAAPSRGQYLAQCIKGRFRYART